MQCMLRSSTNGGVCYIAHEISGGMIMPLMSN